MSARLDVAALATWFPAGCSKGSPAVARVDWLVVLTLVPVLLVVPAASAVPAAAATGSETLEGTIVTSGVSGTRTVITSALDLVAATGTIGARGSRLYSRLVRSGCRPDQCSL